MSEKWCEPRRVAVVLAGAGARGAYEAGVLSVLLPSLEQDGMRPELYIGTSAGAINAALFATHAHLPAAEQAKAVLDVWRSLHLQDVIGPVLWAAPKALSLGVGQILGIRGVRLTGLLNTSPLRRTLCDRIDWDRLRTNIDDGTCGGLIVTATNARTGRSVVFLDRYDRKAAVPVDDRHPIDYVPTRVGPEHLLASAAIPVLFPPVELTDPAGWYCDGGLRLNTPLKPAIALEARSMIVVATSPATYPPMPPTQGGAGEAPDVDDIAVQLLDAALADSLVEDMHSLLKVNQLLSRGGSTTASGRELIQIGFMFVGPDTRGALARAALKSYEEQINGPARILRNLRHPDLPLLAHLLAGDGDRRGDVLSYLLFDADFVQRAIALGQQDAQRALESRGPHGPWRVADTPPNAA
jgi:NTE family protein